MPWERLLITTWYLEIMISRYNINYFRLPDSAKLKSTISYWLVYPTNWSTGHFWIMLNNRSIHWYFTVEFSTVHSIFGPLISSKLSVTVGESDVGDIVKLVTLHVGDRLYVGDISRYTGDFQCIKSVPNISNLSPTHFVSNIRHRHQCNRRDKFIICLILGWF